MAEVSMGVLIDIVDEEWMRDTLDDDVPLPLGMAPLLDEIEDASWEELPQGSEGKWDTNCQQIEKDPGSCRYQLSTNAPKRNSLHVHTKKKLAPRPHKGTRRSLHK